MIIKDILRRFYYYRYYSKFKKCGKNVNLARQGIIARPEEISFGSNVFIGPRFLISARNLIIGNNILIGPNLVIECDDHIFDRIGLTMFDYSSEQSHSGVSIEDDVWIGANVTILKSVTVSEGSVIGANSLLTNDTLPYSISFGCPARLKKMRFSPEELEKHLLQVKSKYSYSHLVKLYQNYDFL
jgi:acetyltransferase-like isoleucine patch superfamily enzyme